MVEILCSVNYALHFRSFLGAENESSIDKGSNHELA